MVEFYSSEVARLQPTILLKENPHRISPKKCPKFSKQLFYGHSMTSPSGVIFIIFEQILFTIPGILQREKKYPWSIH